MVAGPTARQIKFRRLDASVEMTHFHLVSHAIVLELCPLPRRVHPRFQATLCIPATLIRTSGGSQNSLDQSVGAMSEEGRVALLIGEAGKIIARIVLVFSSCEARMSCPDQSTEHIVVEAEGAAIGLCD